MAAAPTDPDLPLVRALQAGDQNALEELIRKYQEPLFRFIYRYAGDEQTARDLLQETFVRLYFNARKFKPRAKFSTWLYTIAANLCRDYARSSQQQKARMTISVETFDQDETRISDTAALPSEALASAERLAAVQAAISELPHKLKTALILFSLENRSQAECAELLGVSAKTVETRVYRARRILGKKLASDEG
ncbi:MAG TPA: sigma-70 family RNA polymerase sigma factor [Candidatus Udaeobacter sp.]|nr:sigma-70 family RNA polymerase sigma factor [Candidatus Udaeobacter sp.]